MRRNHADGVFTVSGPAGTARYEPLLGKGSIRAEDGNLLWVYLPQAEGERARAALDQGEHALWPVIEDWYLDRLEVSGEPSPF